jgi:hypothetical protein
MVKQWLKFKNRKILFMKTLADNLYFKNLDNNEGVLNHVIDGAEEEECKEALLAYYFLLKHPAGMTEAQLDDAIEGWLEAAHDDAGRLRGGRRPGANSTTSELTVEECGKTPEGAIIYRVPGAGGRLPPPGRDLGQPVQLQQRRGRGRRTRPDARGERRPESCAASCRSVTGA